MLDRCQPQSREKGSGIPFFGKKGSRTLFPRVYDVLQDCHVGKERIALKDVADTSGLRPQIDTRGAVEQRPSAGGNPALVWRHQAGDALKRQCLAGSGGANERDDWRFARPLRVECEVAESL